MRKFLKISAIILAILLVISGIAAFVGYKWYENAVYTAPTNEPEPRATVLIKDGDSLLDITPELEKSGHIKSELALKVYLRFNPTTVKLVKGRYRIPHNLNIPDLLKKLNEGPVIETVTMRFREGTRMDEFGPVIVKAFSDFPEARFKIEEFTDITNNPDKYTFTGTAGEYLKAVKPAGKSLEGLMFPDTYNIGVDAPTQAIVELLIATQIQKLTAAGIDYKTNKGQLGSFYNSLIIASIVERESTKASESPLVADIFIRRIKGGDMLGADATLLYPPRNWSYKITAKDLRDTSNVYNSRARVGLIPTPICNPSLSSIKATFAPEANKYYYFLHSADGTTYFARTFAEHSANARKYL